MVNGALDRWQFLAKAFAGHRLPEIVDIGANPLDDPPYKPLLDAGLCGVYGFEPQEHAFERLQENQSTNEHYENCAVGDGQSSNFYEYRQSGLSSTFQIDPRTTEFLGRSARAAQLLSRHQLPTKRLDDISSIRYMDMLKIDVQGAEALIFENARRKLSEAMVVITELRFFPLYQGEPLFDRQVSLLDELGFRFHKFLFVKGQHVNNSQSARLKKRAIRSQALDGDAVFIRDLRNCETIDDDQLRALALLSDAIFESYDVTLYCLDRLIERSALPPSFAEDYFSHLPAAIRRSR